MTKSICCKLIQKVLLEFTLAWHISPGDGGRACVRMKSYTAQCDCIVFDLSFIMFTFNLHIFGLHLIEPTLRFDSLIFHLLRRLPYHRGCWRRRENLILSMLLLFICHQPTHLCWYECTPIIGVCLGATSSHFQFIKWLVKSTSVSTKSPNKPRSCRRNPTNLHCRWNTS